MIVHLANSKNIATPLYYNERKVAKGDAVVLDCVNFFKDMASMDLEDKLSAFRRLTSLNQRTRQKVLHLSLNFHPSEILSNDRLIDIADSYMRQIGFEHQPYIIYRHDDAGHPHIHIVSVNIDDKGRRISLNRLGPNQSKKARISIEKAFNLVKLDHNISQKGGSKYDDHPGKLIYGKSATKQTIERILSQVLGQYRFTNIVELNAILQQYNIKADRGKSNSFMHRVQGLVFQAVDQKGNKRGVPIKASSLIMKPTLSNLQKLFTINKALLIPLRPGMIAKIKWALAGVPGSMDAYILALKKEGIDAVFTKGRRGEIYSLAYIDYKTKSVFEGRTLGKEYDVRNIINRYGAKREIDVNKEMPTFSPAQNKTDMIYGQVYQNVNRMQALIEQFALPLKPRDEDAPSSGLLSAKKKHKKRKRIS